MTSSAVATERTGEIAILTLDRPERLNAVDRAMVMDLIAAVDEADADSRVRGIVITGRGRAFCAGADLSKGPMTFADDSREDTIDTFRDYAGLATLRLFDCAKPVIGAVNGPAVGFGASLVCAMDIRVAAETAMFAFAFTRRGMVPEGASSWFLPRLVGAGRALEWTLTGRAIDAAEALESGLVSAVHPSVSLLDATVSLASEIACGSAPISLAIARRLIWRGLATDHPREVHEVDSRATFERGRSADGAEGITAFLEKRAPVFPQGLDELDAVDPWRDRRR